MTSLGVDRIPLLVEIEVDALGPIPVVQVFLAAERRRQVIQHAEYLLDALRSPFLQNGDLIATPVLELHAVTTIEARRDERIQSEVLVDAQQSVPGNAEGKEVGWVHAELAGIERLGALLLNERRCIRVDVTRVPEAL